MSQGNNAKREGARSNELYTLQALNRIVSAITGQGQPPAPLGIATESTLISVLNAISASDQDIEILLVRDTGDSDLVIQQITNWETGTPVVTYVKVDGTPHTVIGPLEYLDPSAVLNLVLTELLDQGVSLDALLVWATSGQALSANSAPVVLSTEQEVILTAIQAAVEGVLEVNLDATADQVGIWAYDGPLSTDVVKLMVARQLADIGLAVTLSTEDYAALIAIQNYLQTIATGVSGTFATTALQGDIINTLGVTNLLLTNATVSNLTHNYVNTTGSGSVPINTRRGSVSNIGNTDGTWAGGVLPAGVTIPWGDIKEGKYAAIAYDATGTQFLIEYTT